MCLWGLGGWAYTAWVLVRGCSQTPRCSGTLITASSLVAPPGTRKGEESEEEWAQQRKSVSEGCRG